MRLRLVGYSGARPPVPGTVPVDPEDPGPTPDPVPDPDDIPPPLTLALENGDEFHKADYFALGYNRFDVMCIGGAGGRGSDGTPGSYYETIIEYVRRRIQSPQSPTEQLETWGAVLQMLHETRPYGYSGGGGGAHRIKGRLALLPSVVPVIVGPAGNDGINHANGGDGGASSFGGTICRASGGKGGAGVAASGNYNNAPGHGVGGIGNSDTPGGGAQLGQRGSWDGKIGSGGGGTGSGKGGDGSYSSVDTSLAGLSSPGPSVSLRADTYRVAETIQEGPGGYPLIWTDRHEVVINYVSLAAPGGGGGATAFPLTGDPKQYGAKVPGAVTDGAVIVRLTYAIV